MKNRFLSLLACLFAFACSCGDQQEISSARVQDTVPDSVKPYKLFAVFDEDGQRGVTVLALGNQRHPSPRKITYFDNGQVMAEELTHTADGHFQSIDGNAEYRIENEFVTSHYHSLPECLNMGINVANTKVQEGYRFQNEDRTHE